MQGFRCGSLFGAVVVSTGCRWCRVQGLPVSSGGVFRPFVPAFRPFAAFAFLQYLLNMPYFAFLGGFWRGLGCLAWVCVVLVLCAACMAFVRVRCLAVIRLVACLPFFLSLCPCFSSFVLLSWLASLVGFLPCLLSCFFGFVGWFLCLVGLLAFFPFGRLQIRKRGAFSASLRAVCC